MWIGKAASFLFMLNLLILVSLFRLINECLDFEFYLESWICIWSMLGVLLEFCKLFMERSSFEAQSSWLEEEMADPLEKKRFSFSGNALLIEFYLIEFFTMDFRFCASTSLSTIFRLRLYPFMGLYSSSALISGYIFPILLFLFCKIPCCVPCALSVFSCKLPIPPSPSLFWTYDSGCN